MKRIVVAAAMIFAAVAPSGAQEKKPLTVEQCLGILTGLNSLNWVGEQLGETQDKKPADAKQYKLGEVRFTVALDIEALGPVQASYQRAAQQFVAELPIAPAVDPKNPSAPAGAQIQTDNNKRMLSFQLKALAQPCPASNLSHIKLADLKLGDGTDQNQIPVSVLAAFSPIVDR